VEEIEWRWRPGTGLPAALQSQDLIQSAGDAAEPGLMKEVGCPLPVCAFHFCASKLQVHLSRGSLNARFSAHFLPQFTVLMIAKLHRKSEGDLWIFATVRAKTLFVSDRASQSGVAYAAGGSTQRQEEPGQGSGGGTDEVRYFFVGDLN